MPTTITKPVKSTGALNIANHSPMLREVDDLCTELVTTMQRSVALALQVGMRLLSLHQATGESDAPGGFRAALERVADRVPRSTAYRWINAATKSIATHQNLCDDRGNFDPAEITLPDPGTPAWKSLESAILIQAQGVSLRRLSFGSAAISEDSRLDALITASESGDPLADEILEKIAAGQLTLVQAIRAHAGALSTKEKVRKDPIYLDLDGGNGQLTGLFPRCLITLSNTFDHWSDIDESARSAAKAAWKALVSKLPKDLR